MKKRLLGALSVVAATAALSGCAIVSDTASQPNLIGSPTVTTQLCVVGTVAPGSSTCKDNPEPPMPFQVLVAYQVPSDVTAPDEITGSGDRSDRFAFSQTYTDELAAKSPASSGMKWVGYVSDEIDFLGSVIGVPGIPGIPGLIGPPPATHQVETLKATFKVPEGADGSPWKGPFNWLTISGDRVITPTASATRPVVCGSPISDQSDPDPSFPGIGGSAGLTTFCSDSSPLPSVSTLATSDFGVMAPASPQSVQAGNSIDIPFRYQLAGPAIGQPFSLNARTDLGGATVSPADASLKTTSDTVGTELVHLAVPRTALAGVYHVRLNATLPNGQSRTQLASVTVTAVPPVITNSPLTGAGPIIHIAAFVQQHLAYSLAHGLLIGLKSSESATDVVSLWLDANTAHLLHIAGAKRVKVGGRTFVLAPHVGIRVRVPFTRQAKRALKHRKHVKLTVAIVSTDKAGKTTVLTETISLR